MIICIIFITRAKIKSLINIKLKTGNKCFVVSNKFDLLVNTCEQNKLQHTYIKSHCVVAFLIDKKVALNIKFLNSSNQLNNIN